MERKGKFKDGSTYYIGYDGQYYRVKRYENNKEIIMYFGDWRDCIDYIEQRNKDITEQ